MDRIRVHYRLSGSRDGARKLAETVAREQTVELPPATYPPRLDQEVLGQVETFEPAGDAVWSSVVSYPSLVAGDDVAQLLNLVYGNVSLLRGVRVVDLTLPPSVTRQFPGPRRGIRGLRELTGVPVRPLLVSAIKPIGLSAAELAMLAGQLARGGLDVIKDDHGLANQRTAPFRERVARCADAVAEAAEATGKRTLYAPNVTGPLDSLDDRLAHVQSVGCRAVVCSPMLVGLDTLRIAGSQGLAVLAHPSMTGMTISETEGLVPEVLYGCLMRLAGADAVIYTHAGGRFPVDNATSRRIVERARAPLGDLEPALPIAGGGIDLADVPTWMDVLGSDVGFLIGSSLYATGAVEEAARRLVSTVEQVSHAP